MSGEGIPNGTPATTWRTARPDTEPNWDRSRDDADARVGTLCARCVLLLMLPHTVAEVVASRGRFPIMASGPDAIREARQGAGDGHQVIIDGSPFGVYADTIIDGEAACWNHAQYVARDKGITLYL